MVISTPTYHIVSNIPPESSGGRHKLGTIIDNLDDLRPLNEDEEIKIPNACRFCIHEENFEATRDQVQKGSGGVGIKFLASQVPVGGEVGGGGETSVEEIYGFASLDTEWFDPTQADYQNAVKSIGLQDYLDAHLKKSVYASLYMITGMKIGRQPSITRKKGNQIEGRFQLGIKMGNGGTIGPRGDGSRTGNTMQKSEKSTDLVFGIRVRKLSCKKRYYVLGERVWSDKPHNAGAELVGVDREKDFAEEAWFEVEEMELDEELVGCVKKREEESNGETVTWVIPEAAR